MHFPLGPAAAGVLLTESTAAAGMHRPTGYLLSHEAVVQVQARLKMPARGALASVRAMSSFASSSSTTSRVGDCDLHPEGLHLGDGVRLMAAAQAPAVM